MDMSGIDAQRSKTPGMRRKPRQALLTLGPGKGRIMTRIASRLILFVLLVAGPFAGERSCVVLMGQSPILTATRAAAHELR
jgi:hypothetical protein